MTDTDPRTDGIDSHPDPTTGRLGPAVTPLTAGFGHPPSPGHPPDPGDPPDSALLDPGYPRNSGLPELFEARAAAAPLAPAARHRDRVMTYGQLSDGSDRLAARLLAAGVEPGSAVGVCGSRSLEALVAFLGILKAGCAYVPLDEDHPPARLRAMAEDAGVHVAVVLPGSTRRIRGLHTRVELGRVTDAAPPDAADGTPLPVAAATDRAYVMFTSGSTGRPKPVAIAHRGVAQLVLSDPQLPPPGPGDGVLHGYGLSSDASTIEIWSGLLGGACLVLVDREELLAPAALEERFRTHGVTVAYLTTSVFHHLARTRPGALSGLRFASAGGEAMDPGLARAVQTACPGTTLVNFYGPTENSVVSTAYVLPKLTGDETRVPIGRPFATSTCHVLRPDGTPAAPDEEGELYVGGDGLALEYIGDAELTAERFVSLPVDPGGRLYRTGDRAVRGPDGLLEYRGRLDRQVKVRGQRIELDEVEARLRSHAEVGEAVVELRDGVLAAYLTPARPGGTLPVDALRRYCVRWLPAQAVPTLIARDRFPVTSGGKVDRKRLLAESRHDEVSAPRGETREGAPYGSGPGRETRSGPGAEADGPLEALAEVWQLVLRVRPAPTDNFFLIGGDSLLAAEVVARTLALLNLDAALGSGLIRALLSDPTLEGFAAAVGAHLRRPAGLRQAGTAPGAPEAEVDFVRETALGFPLPPARTPLPQPGAPSDVLLTGASGFVGAFLLDRLLRDTTARIHCPVRASGAAHAERRVLAALTRYGLRADDAARQRLVCFPADLAAPGLGLSPEHADGLAACLDLIVHNGAQVNFLYPYSALRAANVEGTREIIGLAAPRRVPVHFLSTVAVLAGFGTAGAREVDEDVRLDHADRLTMGYAESKWVAEGLLRNAAEQGLPVAVYRPYEVTGDRLHGACNTETAICSLFKTIAETGLAPDIALPMDFVPVDHVAESVVYIATRHRATNRVYHLTNPRPAVLRDVLDRMRAAGCEMRMLPYGEWVGELVRHVSRHPTSPTAPFVSLCVDRANQGDISVKEMYLDGVFPRLSRRNTEAALAGSGLDCPPVDSVMLDRYLEYFFTSGYMTRPAVAPVGAAATVS
ncbi:amino acid adenylation domain-containing protein [Streptomyces scopuliridis]|uniref:Amino acid adenylation domain-containing protein n=1 Tax=Streptomyces scopuliridis TaxID=452529 RepID=A0ACD4ZTQ9_9ACTN|nr:amino acid adenylation domain-containing protein [Streptomyces scopuliridis]WSC01412.1 amino acid adenylation domain-containing protein [Streptomyces scopuliridis]WSC05051.1 amino acid adenylation domain-containing protein [Streptomyces scopuliridis]